MRTLIQIECVDQDMVAVSKPVVASGGLHENFVSFTFCSKWDGFTKTAVFYKDINKPYYVILDDTNICEIPHEVTDTKGAMKIGVFGVKGEVTKTSEVIMYQIRQGACSTELFPTDPTPEIWEQLLASYNAVLDKISESNQTQQDFIGQANKAVESCNIAINDCYAAISILNYNATDLDGGDPSMQDIVGDEGDVSGGTPY